MIEPLAHTIIDDAEIITRERTPEELVDAPGLPYQTFVLSGIHRGGYQRYETLEEALAGHIAWVERHETLGNG